MSDELKIGYISKQCLEKLQDPKWQALRGVWVELWTVDGPPSRCVVPVYTFSQNASAQAVDNSSDDSQPMKPGPFVYSAEAEIKGLRTQLATMTAERDVLQTSMNELRKTCAEIIGADEQTWPGHGNVPLAIAACLALRDAELRKTTAERDAALAKVAVLWGVVDDLTDKTEEVIRISDRKHDSWDAAKASIKRAYTALEETK